LAQAPAGRAEPADVAGRLRQVTVPGHALFAHFMWAFRRTRDLYWVRPRPAQLRPLPAPPTPRYRLSVVPSACPQQVLLLPVNVLPLMLSDLPAVRMLGALGIAAGALQLVLSNRIRRHGMQFV
jgi:hypothetical protein